jgi:hypothetical protein
MDRTAVALWVGLAWTIALHALPMTAPPTSARVGQAVDRPTERAPEQRRATEQQRQPQSQPLPVHDVVNPSDNRGESSRQATAAHEPPADNRRMTVFEKWNLFITAVGVVVGIGVLVIYSGQLTQMRLATEATTRALNMTHRPELVVRQLVVDGISDSGHLGSMLTDGYLVVTNIGVLPATLLWVHTEWLYAATLPIENPAFKSFDHAQAPVDMPPGYFAKLPIPDRAISTEEYISINNMVATGSVCFGDSNGTLFLMGYVKYTDVIGPRRTYFCFAYNTELHYFTAVDHPGYSYQD